MGGRHRSWHASVLLTFGPYEWLRFENTHNGDAPGRRKMVPDGSKSVGKETGAAQRRW